ncbi:MAG: TolB family protein [Polyangiaceae bacterium]
MVALRGWLAMLAATAPLLGCSASLRHGVRATDAATQLEQVTRSSTNELDPAVSPDARAIAFVRVDSLGSRPHVEVVAMANAKSARPRPEYSSKDAMGASPAWIPDGSSIVFESDALGASRLVQTVGDGIQVTRYLEPAGEHDFRGAWPAVSRDGRLAFSLGTTTQFQTGWLTSHSLDDSIGITDLFGSGLTIIAGADPAWSPDGRRLVFARISDRHMHLFVGRADGSSALQITDGSEDDLQPAWSPDGRLIVYCAVRANEEGWEQGNLFVVHPDGSGLIQLTEGDALACRPDWASDGYIYFHADARERFHIWRLKPGVESM